MPTDYSAYGIGAGLLAPVLYSLAKSLFGGKDDKSTTGTANTASLTGNTSPTWLPGADGIYTNAKTGVTSDVAGSGFPTPTGWLPGTGAGTGIYTNAKTGVTSDIPGSGFPDPNTAAGGMPSTQDALAALQKLMGGNKSDAAATPSTSNIPRPLAAAPVQPNYAGTGTTSGGSGAMSPQMLAMAMQLPNGGIGAPLGYAASNPLLALMKGRLGVV